MNRLLVALLAAVDALIAAAVGIAAALAPLTVLWTVALGTGADWTALWPASVRLWQFGQLVPLQITLPPEYLTAAGIPEEAATFWLSLAPLAFAGFTAVFAARSGARAARAGAWIVGVLSGAAVTAVVAWAAWRTSGNAVAAVYGWQALVLPTAVFALPALAGALAGAWRHGDDGLVDALRARGAARRAGVVEASARGVGIAALGFVGIGALVVAVAVIARGAEIIALFEAAHVDVMGAVMLALGQLAYLPTLVVWGGAFAAGPGFALGTGATVSPAGTNLGVLPGIPVLGIVPESVSHWMLLSVLLLVAVGFVAGAAARARLAAAPGAGARAQEPSGPRAVALAAITIGGGAITALLAAVASGSIGPGRLAEVGPSPGPVAFAVGVELLVGAAIGLFSPASPVRRRAATAAVASAADTLSVGAVTGAEDVRTDASVESVATWSTDAGLSADDEATQPFAPADLDPLASLAGLASLAEPAPADPFADTAPLADARPPTMPGGAASTAPAPAPDRPGEGPGEPEHRD